MAELARSLLTPSGDDGAATPSVPSRVPLPDHIAHEGTCQFPNAHRFAYPAASSLAGTLAHALPAKVDGRAPLSLHVMSSAVCLVGDDKITTRKFADGQKVFDGSSNAQ